jgi:hypothetical protein
LAVHVVVNPYLQNAPETHTAPIALQSPPIGIAPVELALALQMPGQHDVLIPEQAVPLHSPETHSWPL